MFPADSVKTVLQTAPTARPATFREAVGVVRLRGPFRGASAVALSAAPAHALYFGVYEAVKKYMPADEALSHATAGALATLASDSVMTPFDAVKQRMQLGTAVAAEGSKAAARAQGRLVAPPGARQTLRMTARRMWALEGGLRPFFVSLPTTLAMNVPMVSAHFVAYEKLSAGLKEAGVPGAALLAGAGAGAVSAAVTTPLDVVKTRLQTQGVGEAAAARLLGVEGVAAQGSAAALSANPFKPKVIYSGFFDVMSSLLFKEGAKPSVLFRGLSARVLFHSPAGAICWGTYETVKVLL